MINNFIPFIVLGYFLYYLINNRSNNILTGLIFVSFFIFATNYTNYGLDFAIFRYLHRAIGIIVVIALFIYIFKNKINFLKHSVPQILILFFLVLLLSFLGNDLNVEHYLHYVRNFIFIASIATYLYYSLDSKEKLEELFSLIVVITVILSGFVFLELMQNLIFGEGGRAWGNRSRLFFPNANYLAFSLLPGLLIALFRNNQKYARIIALFIVITIFATGSRAAELSSCFALVAHLLYFKYRAKYLIPFLLSLVLILIVFFDNIVFNHNFSDARYVLSRITLNIFKEHPINGIGYGQFKLKFHKYIDQDIIEIGNSEINDVYLANYPNSKLYTGMSKTDLENYTNLVDKEKMTHNDFLTIIAELGFLGIACTVFIFYKLYIELQKLLLHNRKYFFLSIGLIGSSLIFSLFHNNLRKKCLDFNRKITRSKN